MLSEKLITEFPLLTKVDEGVSCTKYLPSTLANDHMKKKNKTKQKTKFANKT